MAARSSPGSARVLDTDGFEDGRVESGLTRVPEGFGQTLRDRRDRKAHLVEQRGEHRVPGGRDNPGVERLMVVSRTDRVSPFACFLEEGQVAVQLGDLS